MAVCDALDIVCNYLYAVDYTLLGRPRVVVPLVKNGHSMCSVSPNTVDCA